MRLRSRASVLECGCPLPLFHPFVGRLNSLGEAAVSLRIRVSSRPPSAVLLRRTGRLLQFSDTLLAVVSGQWHESLRPPVIPPCFTFHVSRFTFHAARSRKS